MTSQDWETYFVELDLPQELSHGRELPGEKIIRGILLAGFLAILLLEGWLIWQLFFRLPV